MAGPTRQSAETYQRLSSAVSTPFDCVDILHGAVEHVTKMTVKKKYEIIIGSVGGEPPFFGYFKSLRVVQRKCSSLGSVTVEKLGGGLSSVHVYKTQND